MLGGARQTVLFQLGIASLLAFGIGVELARADNHESPDPVVHFLSGSAKLKTGDAVTAGQILPWGSRIEVAAGAKLQVVAQGRFAATAWGPTEVSIVQTGPRKTTWLDVLYGRVIAAFAQGREAAIATPTSVAGVRGTVVYVENTEKLPDYQCTCEGTVNHQHRLKPMARLVTATHHDAPVQASKLGFQASEMHNHTDDDVAATKALLE